MKLHDYQQDIVDGVTRAMSNHSRLVVACPTGSGKTVIALIGILPVLPAPVAWITHRRELAEQAREYGSSVHVRMVGNGVPVGYKSIIIDEGHHVCADQYKSIIRGSRGSIIIALTATPYRLDGEGLGSCGFSKIIYGPDILELTNRAMLCPARVMVPVSELNRSWTVAGCFDEISKAKFKKGIVYCRSVSDARDLSKMLTKNGIQSDCVDGETPLDIRNKSVSEFRSGSTKILCNHTIFTEGSDIPEVDLIVLNRPTQSRCLWKQMIGRGIRLSPGKKICTVLDLAANSVLHGSIYDKETYDLNGKVESVESFNEGLWNREISEYEYNEGDVLKEWKPQPKPVRLIESLQQRKSISSLLRYSTV